MAGASAQSVEQLCAAASWRSLAGNDVVVDAGDASDDVYFVLEGTVRVVMRSPSGHEAVLNDLEAGHIFGEIAAIDGIQRSANVTALVRSKLCSVPGPTFMQVVLGCPPLALRLMRMLTARVRVKDERMLEATTLPARQRLAAELLRLSTDRGGGERKLSPPLPQHILAARIGTSRETVSRELARMVRSGLVTMTKSAIILHRPSDLLAQSDDSRQGSA